MVRILLADDHAVVRRGLRALLEARQDFEVCAEASNGREAVELALQHKPDVAVLDISLTQLNGIEVTRQIRKEMPGARAQGKFGPFPPPTALLLLPLARLSPLSALRVTTAVSLLCLLVSIWLLARIVPLDLIDSAVLVLLSGYAICNG